MTTETRLPTFEEYKEVMNSYIEDGVYTEMTEEEMRVTYDKTIERLVDSFGDTMDYVLQYEIGLNKRYSEI